MNIQYTDFQLKQALAKLLPETVSIRTPSLFEFDKNKYFLCWNLPDNFEQVKDTELLDLCWMVEEPMYQDSLTTPEHEQPTDWHNYQWLINFNVHATWQQRVIALAKVKGVEIV